MTILQTEKLLDWIFEKGYKKDVNGNWYIPNESTIRFTTGQLIKVFKLLK